MLLGIDIGNTELKAGLFEGEELLGVCRLAAGPHLPGEELASRLVSLFALKGLSLERVKRGIYASVVPAQNQPACEALRLICGSEPLCVGPGVKTGLNLRVDNPLSMGADFVCCAVGALARYRPPLAIFDLGTASAVTVLDREGAFVGKAILCGVGLGITALHEHTAALPQPGLQAPAALLGRGTADALICGAAYGAAAAVDGLFSRYEATYGPGLTGILTGGHCGLVAPLCEKTFIRDPFLSLYGLRQIFLKNRHALQ